MKKLYSKPEIVFESFTLSNAIAAGCEYTNPQHEDLKMSDGTYMFTSEGNCGSWVDEAGGDGAYGNICYHVPTGINLFVS